MTDLDRLLEQIDATLAECDATRHSTKPSVRRARTYTGDLAPGWDLITPAYGFGRTTIRTYPSWRAAHRALVRPLASAGPLVERNVGYLTGITAGSITEALR